MNDWKAQLREVAAVVREQQKNKKGVTEKFDTIKNFKGRTGVNDAGIPLTQKQIKKKQRNRLNYHYRYPQHLKDLNDARHKSALKRWGLGSEKPRDSHVPAARRHSFHPNNRTNNTFLPTFEKKQKLYIYYDSNSASSNDGGSVELDPYVVDAACESVINQDPVFENKIQEDTWRIKNKK